MNHAASLPPVEVPEQWDFYFCRVDDAAASIALNFWYRNRAPLPGASTLYWCDLELLQPGADGMGDGADAEQLYPLEEAITKQATALGLYHVARVRSHGRWQLFYYGPAGADTAFRRGAKQAIPTHRPYDVGSKNDQDWVCYFDFLCPDEERWQWILDRRSVEALAERGDPLIKPRRVDHWVVFSAEQERAGFLTAVAELGFEPAPAGKTGSRRRCTAQIHRVDSVELEDIHGTVMELKLLAEEHGGDYQGWETTVEKALN